MTLHDNDLERLSKALIESGKWADQGEFERAYRGLANAVRHVFDPLPSGRVEAPTRIPDLVPATAVLRSLREAVEASA